MAARGKSAGLQDKRTLIAVIGDEDTVTGFLLTGIGERNHKGETNFFVVDSQTTAEELENTLNGYLERKDIAIILVNQNIAEESLRHIISQHNAVFPTILEIPSKECPYDPEKDTILRRANRTLFGADRVEQLNQKMSKRPQRSVREIASTMTGIDQRIQFLKSRKRGENRSVTPVQNQKSPTREQETSYLKKKNTRNKTDLMDSYKRKSGGLNVKGADGYRLSKIEKRERMLSLKEQQLEEREKRLQMNLQIIRQRKEGNKFISNDRSDDIFSSNCSSEYYQRSPNRNMQVLSGKEESLQKQLKQLQIRESQLAKKQQEFRENSLESEKLFEKLDEETRKIVSQTVLLEIIWKLQEKSFTEQERQLKTQKNQCIELMGKMADGTNRVAEQKMHLDKELKTIEQIQQRIDGSQLGSQQQQINSKLRSVNDGKQDQALQKREKALKSKEQTYEQRYSRVVEWENRLNERKQKLEGQQDQSNPDQRALLNKLQEQEKSLKMRENKINETKLKQNQEQTKINEIHAKMQARLQNLIKIETKSQQSINALNQRRDKFLKEKQQEEARLNDWENDIKRQEQELECADYVDEDYSDQCSDNQDLYDSVGEDQDFAANFLYRQEERRMKQEQLNKEKKDLSQQLNDILSELT